MPYLKPERRQEINRDVAGFSVAKTAGELNYLFTLLCTGYLMEKGELNGKISYQDLNDIIGALEGAKAEFYRRVVVPFEDLKIKENGDVY